MSLEMGKLVLPTTPHAHTEGAMRESSAAQYAEHMYGNHGRPWSEVSGVQRAQLVQEHDALHKAMAEESTRAVPLPSPGHTHAELPTAMTWAWQRLDQHLRHEHGVASSEPVVADMGSMVVMHAEMHATGHGEDHDWPTVDAWSMAATVDHLVAAHDWMRGDLTGRGYWEVQTLHRKAHGHVRVDEAEQSAEQARAQLAADLLEDEIKTRVYGSPRGPVERRAAEMRVALVRAALQERQKAEWEVLNGEVTVDGRDLLERAWGLIANNMDVTGMPQEEKWRMAAVAWRDDYHALLPKLATGFEVTVRRVILTVSDEEWRSNREAVLTLVRAATAGKGLVVPDSEPVEVAYPDMDCEGTDPDVVPPLRVRLAWLAYEGNPQEPCGICSGYGCPDCRQEPARPEEPFEFQPNHDGTLPLETAVFQALGAASTCWENLRGAGIFNSTRAKEIGDKLLAHLRKGAEPGSAEGSTGS